MTEYLKVYVEVVFTFFPICFVVFATGMTLLCLMKLFFEKPRPKLLSLVKPWAIGALGGAFLFSAIAPLLAIIEAN